MIRVDINADSGELPPPDGLASDIAMLEYVTSVNVACGGHAGSRDRMLLLARECRKTGTAFGAHPSFEDRIGFGRIRPATIPAELRQQLQRQLALANAAATAAGIHVSHVKPHGALYHEAEQNPSVRELLLEVIRETCPDTTVIGLGGGKLVESARSRTMTAYEEFFPDRAYVADGNLKARNLPGALITDPEEVLQRAIEAIRFGRVRTGSGSAVSVRAETLCLHGDHKGAVLTAQHLRRGLEKAKICVTAPPLTNGRR